MAGLGAAALALIASAGCDRAPQATVVLDNDYAPMAAVALPVYFALWQAVVFADPVAPGSSSPVESSLAATDNTAYVVLAPGWDPTSKTPPTSFILMQSRSGFTVHLDETLHIPVDDSTFVGNCAAGSFLSQEQADFIAERVFTSAIFDAAPRPFHYDAATCAMSPLTDGGP